MTYTEEKVLIKEAASKFPEEFGLKAFPGDVFRISESASYYSAGYDNEWGKCEPGVLLYAQILLPDGKTWSDFSKGTTTEFAQEVVQRPSE